MNGAHTIAQISSPGSYSPSTSSGKSVVDNSSVGIGVVGVGDIDQHAPCLERFERLDSVCGTE